jgi:hypothetical protein
LFDFLETFESAVFEDFVSLGVLDDFVDQFSEVDEALVVSFEFEV